MEATLKTSHHALPMPQIYQEIVDEVGSKFDDIAFRWSRKRVPHLLLEHAGVVYSLYYFMKHGNWRTFYPYQTQQYKKDFGTWQEAIDFIVRG